jgi:hypothetical protein
VCHHVERRREREKESVAYHHRGLEWDRACMLQQQAEVEVVHMVDMLAEKKRESSVSKLKNILVRCPIGASKVNRVLTETG